MTASRECRTEWCCAGETWCTTLSLYPFAAGAELTMRVPEPIASRIGRHVARVRMVGYSEDAEPTGCYLGAIPLACIVRTITLELVQTDGGRDSRTAGHAWQER